MLAARQSHFSYASQVPTELLGWLGSAGSTRLRAASLVTLMVSTLLGSPVSAQTVLHTFRGETSQKWFGWSVAGAGDVNADGYDDIIVGAPESGSGELADVYSGRDGTRLHRIPSPPSTNAFGAEFGRAVSGAGDVNGDGFDDFVVGAEFESGPTLTAGSARVYSGLDGAVLYEWFGTAIGQFFGASVASAGDTNGDGFPDIIVGSSRFGANVSGVPDAQIFSGLDGTVLQSLFGGGGADVSVSGAGDVNADGFADVVMTGGVTGIARIISGLDGSLLYMLPTPSSAKSVSGAGDVNSDGFSDVIVGTATEAQVFSGSDGSLMYSFASGSFRCSSSGFVGGAGDVDGDGFADLIVGECRGGGAFAPGIARIFSGATGGLLFEVTGGNQNARFGWSVSGAGDVNGDGLADVVVGAPFDGENDLEDGRVWIFSGVPVSTIGPDVCSGDGGDQAGCTNCPCGNNAVLGTIGGCLNSAGTSAQLLVTGSTSVSLPSGSALDLRVALTSAIPSSLCVLRSGEVAAPGNPASPCFGLSSGIQALAFDGLRCAILGVRRHGARMADSNGSVGLTNSPWGGEGGPDIGLARFAGFVPGENRFFQVIGRDFANLSCMRGLNTTQAIRVVFQP